MKEKIIQAMKAILSVHNWGKSIGMVLRLFKTGSYFMYSFTGLFLLLFFFLAGKIWCGIEKVIIIGFPLRLVHVFWNLRFKKWYTNFIELIESKRSSEVRRSYLIEIAYKNLMIKKTRSLITIFGMSVGVGVIVLLLSLGYGIERLIISRVASLDELRIVDVSTGENTSVRINQSIINKIAKMPKVDTVIPLVSVVGRISYNKATTDVVVYAVPRHYLDFTRVQLIKGKLFANNDSSPYAAIPQVAGASTQLIEGKKGSSITDNDILFNIPASSSATVWSTPDITAKVLGYTTRIVGGYHGTEVWGGEYAPFRNKGREAVDRKTKDYLGRWIKTAVPLFQKNVDDVLTPVLNEYGQQLYSEGYIQAKQIQVVEKYTFPKVLGESTSASQEAQMGFDTTTISTNSAGIELISLQSSDSQTTTKTNKLLSFTDPPSGNAIVSTAFLNLLNIPLTKAVGVSFKSQFIIGKSLIPDINGKVLSSEAMYTINGVVEDSVNPYFYAPITDLQSLGITNYSQTKVVLKNQESLPGIRKEIDNLGLRTTSTVDTVNQIESLFSNLRLILGLLGMVALGVASLGMFNTLTVSLLERTREIGGMKTIGMVSSEVQDLFLGEAMIMGFSGGIGGLLLGYAVGKVISLVVSLVALANGSGYLDLTYIPTSFVLFIIGSSFVVGILTGLYPSIRARKISALNALRYE
ncbi:FtsX-like permease family protein [Candidatus Roizmanbacteria bacterium]|nr:FtsX-like permease family protein [Candidatus Roizmanbacteria bacterium]